MINSTAGDSYATRAFARPGEVDDLETSLASSGVEFELRQPVGVDAADELLAAMDRPEADLLVIGIRHRNPVGKLLLGSVSQQLILECPKPVLTVKPVWTDPAESGRDADTPVDGLSVIPVQTGCSSATSTAPRTSTTAKTSRTWLPTAS